MSRSSATTAVWVGNSAPIRSRTIGTVLGSLFIEIPLTKQVLGRLAYKGDRGPGVPGRGPAVARRQSRRRIRRAQGPWRAGARASGIRAAGGMEPASRQGGADVSGLAGRARW